MSPHDIPDTPSIREKVARDSAESMHLMGLDGPEVQPWEDGFRTHDSSDHAFEWWYFDMELDDGSALVATFNTKPNAAPSWAKTSLSALVAKPPFSSGLRLSGAEASRRGWRSVACATRTSGPVMADSTACSMTARRLT